MDDDFSDSEAAHLAAHHAAGEQDEQHAQKMNGQLELLQTKNKELLLEVKAERATIDRLKHELSLARLELGQAPTVEGGIKSVSSESLGGAYISNELKHEMVAFCAAHDKDLGVTLHDAHHATDAMCISILKAATSMIKSGKAASRTGTAATGRGGGTAAGAQAAKEQVLIERIKDLESELKLALGAAEDIRALKAKLLQLVDRVRQEKESKMKADAELALTTKKMQMLADHLEKLMTHLKHEAAAKIRAMEQLRVADKEMAKVKEKSELIARKSAAKDRLVLELREGCKILEDQLRLMDEKYLELRTKLDWARENSEKKVRSAVAKAKELRVKFALMGNTMPLDKVPLPDIHGNASVLSTESESMMSRGGGDGGSIRRGGPGGHRGGGSAPGMRKHSNTSQSLTSLDGNNYTNTNSGGGVGFTEPNIDHVLEKIRKKAGGKVDWDDHKLRDLTKSR